MDDLKIKSTKSSPGIDFDAKRRILSIRGESYPENAARTYQPMFDWLKEFLHSPESDGRIEVRMEIVYFNSSSSKIFLNFFETLQEAVVSGKDVVVNWYFDGENETAFECGEEFKEDLDTLEFNLVEAQGE